MIIDANIILRCLLQDNYELAEKAKSFIDNNDCFVPTEVIAEVVFVLLKVYNVPRTEIAERITTSFEYYEVQNEQLLKKALEYFGTTTLDFVDCLLAAYHSVENEEIATLDKKLKNFINSL